MDFTMSFFLGNFELTNTIKMKKLERKIVVKVCDQLVSAIHEDKVINEYLLYVVEGDTRLYADVAMGEMEKNLVMEEMFAKYFDRTQRFMYDLPQYAVENISFEQFKAQEESLV